MGTGTFGGPGDRRREWEKVKRGPWCFYCGVIGAWFQCACREAVAARAGEIAKPRVVRRGALTVIVLEREVMERPWNRARLPEYEAPPIVMAPPEALVSEAENLVGIEEARRRYQAEWARANRAKKRGDDAPEPKES